MKTCQKNAGYDNFVVAYGDGYFGLTMKGMDCVGSAYRRLMIRLSKRADDYRTTNACPVCKNYDLKMKCPKENATYYNKYLNKEFRKQINGLSLLRML